MSMLDLDEKTIIKKAAELFLSRKLAELAVGDLTGKEVVSAHRCIIEKVCGDKYGWEALECIIDNMDKLYERIHEVGFEKAMEEMTCPV